MFGLDTVSLIIGILLGWFALPYLWAMIVGMLGSKKMGSMAGA